MPPLPIHTLTPPLASAKRRKPATLAVLHATAGGTFDGAVQTLREKGLAYDFLVKDEDDAPNGAADGKIVRCIPEDRYGYHAGSSWGPEEERDGVSRALRPDHYYVAGCSVNDYSIGISLVNWNDGKDPYSAKQIEAVTQLLHYLKLTIPSLTHVTTHAIVSPARKTDPIGFPLDRVAAAAGLKVWRPQSGPGSGK